MFGIQCEETDSLPETVKGFAEFNGKEYEINHICDIIHSISAKVLGRYKSDFYKGMPCVTENGYGKGKAYYVAFRNDGDLAFDFCKWYAQNNFIRPDCNINAPYGVSIKKRGNYIFVLNFSDNDQAVILDGEYIDILTNKKIKDKIVLSEKDFLIVKQA